MEKLLTIDNIEKLLEIFEENDLIKGLLWVYKEVRQDKYPWIFDKNYKNWNRKKREKN